MHETDNKALWGDIPPTSSTTTAVSKLGKSIDKYKKRTKGKSHKVSSSTTGPVKPEEEKCIKFLCQDPVGLHLINLRKYAIEMEILFQESSDFRAVQKLKPAPPFPDFPEKYPFCDKLKELAKDSNKMIMKYRPFQEKHVCKKRDHFVKQVLLHAGFYGGEPLAIHHLSETANQFLESIVRILRQYKNSDSKKSGNLMNALEATFHVIGFGGISGIHNFYYQNFVKKHDVLQKQCIEMQNKYEKLKQPKKSKARKRKITEEKGNSSASEERGNTSASEERGNTSASEERGITSASEEISSNYESNFSASVSEDSPNDYDSNVEHISEMNTVEIIYEDSPGADHSDMDDSIPE